MALQSSVNVDIHYAAEANLAVTGAGSGKSIRRVSSSLALAKGAFSSREVRPDQEVSDARHGARRVNGGIAGELSTQTYDDFIEACLRGTWANGVSASNLGALSANTTNGTYSIAAGSFITAGLRVGMVFKLTAGGGANAGINFRITTLSATSMTVHPKPAATLSGVATWTMAVQGKTLIPGTEKRSFTIEQAASDISQYELFRGCRFNDMAIQIPPTGMATVNFGVMGIDMDLNQSANYGSPTAAPNTGLLTGVDGSLALDGVGQAILTGMSINTTCNISGDPVVFSKILPELFYGTTVVTGDLSAYFADEALMNYFIDETEGSISAQLNDANGTDFLAFAIPRLKVMGISKQVGPDGGVILQGQWQGLLNTSTAGGQSTGSIMIQRSNA